MNLTEQKYKSYDEMITSPEKNNKDKSLLLNTVVDIHDVWDKANKLNFTTQIPLGIYLNNHELTDIGEETKRFCWIYNESGKRISLFIFY